MAYEVLTGRPPFLGTTSQMILAAHMTDTPEPVSKYRASVPIALEQLVIKCLEKKAADRWQSADELLQHLEALATTSGGITRTDAAPVAAVSAAQRDVGGRAAARRGGDRNMQRGLAAAAVLALIVGGVWLGTSRPFEAAPGDAGHRPVVAVLPFDNLSPEPENAYFADGIHEDVHTHLSQIRDLTVLARVAVAPYRDADMSVGEVAAQLGASAVLAGSVRRAGEQIRIVARLIDPNTGGTLWAETYTRRLTLENVFAVQTEVAQRVARALEIRLSPEEEERLAMRPTESLAAYDLYMKGREAYHRYQNEENDEAIRLYRSALDLDSEYALAWAGLADAFAQRVCCFGYHRAWADSAVHYARTAASLNPELAEAHKAPGIAYSAQERRPAAVDAYLRAVELDPNHMAAVANVGFEYRQAFGRYDEAITWNHRAVELAPNHPTARMNVALTYTRLMMEEKASEWLESVLVLDPDHVAGRILLAELALAEGDMEKALALDEEIVRTSPNDEQAWMGAAEVAYVARDFERAIAWVRESIRIAPDNIARHHSHGTHTLLGLSLVLSGDHAEGQGVLRRAMRDHEQRIEEGAEYWQFPWDIAAAHAALGEEEAALDWLDRAYDAGFRVARMPKVDPAFDDLRDDPRFEVWIARLEADVAAMRQRVIEEERAAGFR